MRVDLAIAGGGPAGAAAALAAARLGLRVVVLESAREPALKPGEWLAPTAAPVLGRLGLTSRLARSPEVAVQSLGVRASWGGPQPHHLDAMRTPGGGGWLVDRRRFETLLADVAVAAGALWCAGRTVGAVQREGGLWRLSASDDSEAVDCSVLLDCTGRRAAVARRLGARVRSLGRQVAQAWWLTRPGPPPPPWLTVEAVPDGWWYHAVAPGSREVVVRVTDAADRNSGTSMPRPPDGSLISQVLGGGPLEVVGHLVRPAGPARLDGMSGPGWLAVGDAACAFDPIAAQGLPTALAAGEAAALAARDWLDGDREALQRCAERMAATHAHSLDQLGAHYATEERWPDSPFWRLRRGTPRAA